MPTLGARIKEIRHKFGITQKEFSERVYVTQSYVSRLEAGQETPTDMLIKLIALEFNVPLDWLKDGKGSIEIQKGNYDYFDRAYTDAYAEGIDKVLSDFKISMATFNNDLIYQYFYSMMDNISALLALFKNSSNQGVLVIEELVNEVLCYVELIQFLEALDTSATDYIAQIYQHIGNATNDFNKRMMEIAGQYSKKESME